MANILDDIIKYKQEFVEQCKTVNDLAKVKDQALRLMELGQCRNFKDAVTKDNPRGINVIAEVKKASPSAGVIRENFEPVEIAKIYQDCKADAISCLTDEKYFQGKIEYLTAIKQAVELPVLRKDFIIDSYQVYEARANGADAILLIAEAIEIDLLVELMNLANELTMGVLVEVHSEKILGQIAKIAKTAAFEKYNITGINNRNLTTMTVDIDNTFEILNAVNSISEVVSESGIKTRQDVQKLIDWGVNAVLIGQRLCQSENIAEKFRELFATV